MMIAVWCIAGIVDGYLTNRSAAQSQVEAIRIQWKKIGLLPFFKGRRVTDTGETLSCPICELYFKAENIESNAVRVLTLHAQEVLKRKYADKVITLDEVTRIYEEIPRDDTKDTARSLAQKVGEALGADLILVGTVWKYTNRIKEPMGPGRGASVAFEMYLMEVAGGKTVWKAKFDETQRPLTENIRAAKVLLRKGVKWLSAFELAHYGVEEVFKKFPL
jgi:hypothetical protein